MKNILFLGNGSSAHIKTWVDIYNKNEMKIEDMYSVHELPGIFAREKKIHWVNKIVSYTLLGLILRIKGRNQILHAHGGAGYGLSAFLSGQRYIVTIYGSEVLGRHNFLYRHMMKVILKNAAIITVTSLNAKNEVLKIIKSKKGSNIFCFHTGIDVNGIDNSILSIESELDKFVYLSIRNCSAVYRTENLIRAYLKAFPKVQKNVTLRVIFGNGDEVYFNKLKSLYSRSDISYSKPFPMEHRQMVNEMSQASVCLNYPVTDQLSATLLEAIYLGKRIISSEQPCYHELIDLGIEEKQLSLVKNDEALVNEITAAYSLSKDFASTDWFGSGKVVIDKNFRIGENSGDFVAMVKKL